MNAWIYEKMKEWMNELLSCLDQTEIGSPDHNKEWVNEWMNEWMYK